MTELRRFLVWFGGKDLADDLVQETFFKAWRARGKFRGDSSDKTWLIAIAKNVAIDSFRKRKPTQPILEPVSSECTSYELRELIEVATMSMTAEKRSCFVLFYKLGFSIKEISVLENVPEGTIKSRLHAARDEFTKYLKKLGVEHG